MPDPLIVTLFMCLLERRSSGSTGIEVRDFLREIRASQVLYPAELRAHILKLPVDLKPFVFCHLRKSLAQFCDLLFIDRHQFTKRMPHDQ